MEIKFVDFLSQNAKRLLQPEQDVINLCCYPKIKYLPIKNIICSYLYDIYENDEALENDPTYGKIELQEALKNPIQLHFATHIKPWNNPGCAKAEEWFKVLAKTEFLKDYLIAQSKEEAPKVDSKTIFSLQMKMSKNKTLCLELTRTKEVKCE